MHTCPFPARLPCCARARVDWSKPLIFRFGIGSGQWRRADREDMVTVVPELEKASEVRPFVILPPRTHVYVVRGVTCVCVCAFSGVIRIARASLGSLVHGSPVLDQHLTCQKSRC